MGEEGELAAEKHVHYIVTVEKKEDSFESLVMEHIRLNGAYWGLTTLDLLHELHAGEVVDWIMSCYHPESDYVAGLQNEDGSFYGDIWGEVDTRFSYVSICSLSLLHRLHKINVEKIVDYTATCKNLDGGFGAMPGGESHAGQRISLDGDFVSANLEREGSMGGLRNLLTCATHGGCYQA